MRLDDILKQQSEINSLIESLSVIHKKALCDPSLSSSLDNIRNDIEVCFNDQCVLNDMLTSHNGEIKEEIDALRAVSYTHLDVYKRQLLYCSLGFGWGIAAFAHRFNK